MENLLPESMLQTAVNEFIKVMISELKPVFKGLKAKVEHFVRHDIQKYLEKQNRYAFIKTLLHRHEPVYLYEVYQPLRLEKDGKTRSTNSIADLLSGKNFITIIGEAGSGKSVLIKHLLLTCIKEKAGIPLLVELRDLNNYQGSLEEFLRERLYGGKIAPNEEILAKLLESGKFVFFLDGYDEIKSSAKANAVLSLNEFIAKYDQNKFILTTRPYTHIELLPLFSNYRIDHLNDKDIEQFVRKQVKEIELVDKILTSIKGAKAVYIRSFLANPLLLSLYILTFRTYSAIPDKKYIFYRNVIQVLFLEHDSLTKLGYQRERVSSLNHEQMEEILKRFSFLTYFEGVYDFERDYLNSILTKVKKAVVIPFDNELFIRDLKVGTAIWVEDSGVMSFAHRSLQEYFAALFVTRLRSDLKKAVYDRLKENLTQKRLHETQNFLSLCQEMDDVDYYSCFLIPVLSEVLGRIDTGSDRSIVVSVLGMAWAGLTIVYDAKGDTPHGFIPEHFVGDEEAFLHLVMVDEQGAKAVNKIERSIINIFSVSALKKYAVELPDVPETAQYYRMWPGRKGSMKAYRVSFRSDRVSDALVTSILESSTFGIDARNLVENLRARIAELREFVKRKNKADETLIKVLSEPDPV
jgi:hypothetical protein